MKAIDATLLRKFLSLAGNQLSGDWVILGGSVLTLRGISYRVTNDIDLAGPQEATQEQLLILFGIAEELGLPIEAINQAAAFFLYQIKDWRNHLIKVHSGRGANFFCPDDTLFLRLKFRRLSEIDLSDCLEILKNEKGTIEPKLLEKDLKRVIRDRANPERRKRAEHLLSVILSAD